VLGMRQPFMRNSSERMTDESLQPTLLLSLSKTVSYMKTRVVKTTLSYIPKGNSTQNFHISPPIYISFYTQKSSHVILSSTNRKTDPLRSTVHSEQHEDTKKGLSTYIFCI